MLLLSLGLGLCIISLHAINTTCIQLLSLRLKLLSQLCIKGLHATKNNMYSTIFSGIRINDLDSNLDLLFDASSINNNTNTHMIIHT